MPMHLMNGPWLFISSLASKCVKTAQIGLPFMLHEGSNFCPQTSRFKNTIKRGNSMLVMTP